MEKIKIGWSEIDISPKEPIALAGQFYERVSEYIESPLTCTAMAVESDGDKMVIVSCDLVSISDEINAEAKKIINEKIGLDPDKIIFHAIHSHTSYTYRKKSFILGKATGSFNYLKENMPEDMAYLSLNSGKTFMDADTAYNIILDGMVKAVIEAWNNRTEACYQNAFGRVSVGHCRRACYDDGSAKMWGETNLANFTALEAGEDSGMELIYTFDKDKNLVGVVANIACPAQVAEHRNFVSADYWGKVKQNLEAKFGRRIFVLGLCSAAGDQCPRDLIRWVDPETPVKDPNIKHYYPVERRADPSMFDKSGLYLVGKRVANEIVNVLEELGDDYKDEAILKHQTVKLLQPLRRVTISEYENAKKEIDEFIAKNRGRRINFEDNARLHVYSGTISRYNQQQEINDYEIEVHYIRFGDVAICTNPYELFLDYGNQIRARSHAKQTFIIQLACGSAGYLPTEKAEKGSHYSAYVSSGYTGHVGGDILVRETIKHINEKFDD